MAGRPRRNGKVPRDGSPPRVPCQRFIESKGRLCDGLAEEGAVFCRFHGSRSPTHVKGNEERVQEYKDRLIEMGEEALQNLQEKLKSPNHAVSLRAAIEILDRAGATATRKSESHVTITEKSDLDRKIEELMQRAPRRDGLGVPSEKLDEDISEDA